MITCDKSLQNLAWKGLQKLGFSKEEIKKELNYISSKKAYNLLQNLDDEKLEQLLNNISLEEAKKKYGLIGAVLLSILTVSSLSSCGNPFLFNFKGYTINNEDFETSWKSVSDYPYIINNNYWPSPEQFESKGGGMCGGFSIMLLYKVGPGYSLGIIRSKTVWPDRTDIDESSYHAIVCTPQGQWLEPQTDGKYYTHITNKDFKKIYTYEEAMRIATWLGIKGITTPELEETNQMRQELESLKMNTVPAPGK